jgi:hypothetical protein
MLQMIGKLIIELSSCKIIENYCKVTEFDKLKSETNKIGQKYKMMGRVI